jgi:hypothetical protein
VSREKRQQFRERRQGGTHDERQSAEPEKPCGHERQRKLDRVHGFAPQAFDTGNGGM